MPFLGLAVIQILLAFVSASILHQVVLRRTFLRWLASHKFVCWLAPSNQELTALKKGGSGETKKARQRNKSKGSPSPSKDEGGVFKISAASLDSLKLNKSILSFNDFDILHNSYDLEWMVDLAVMSVSNFIITEFVFYFLSRTNETNLSQIWIGLVIAYSVLNLWRLTRSYFANPQSSGEQNICIVSAFVFMFISMLILIVDENNLEFGLETAYKSFNETATAFISNRTLIVSDPKAIRRPISFLMVKFSLAVLCALNGMVFTFPGFRYAQMHKHLIDSSELSNFARYFVLFNFASPIMVMLLWVKPISREMARSFDVSDAAFDTFRIYFIIIVNLIKFISLPIYVTSFLKSVHYRIRGLRRRGGSTTNKEIQLTVSSVYNYVNVVIIQYLLPILMCLSTVLLFKSLAGYSWLPPNSSSIFKDSSNQNLNPSLETISTTTMMPTGDDEFGSMFGTGDNTTAAPKLITLQEIKGVFTYDVCRGVMGFATWWLHFSWFLTSLAGIVYHTYFMQ